MQLSDHTWRVTPWVASYIGRITQRVATATKHPTTQIGGSDEQEKTLCRWENDRWYRTTG